MATLFFSLISTALAPGLDPRPYLRGAACSAIHQQGALTPWGHPEWLADDAAAANPTG